MATRRARPARLVPALAPLLLLILLPAPGAGAAAADPLAAALSFLVARQNAEGTWADPPTGVGGAYVVEAAAEAGLDPWTWPSAARPAVAALRDSASTNPDTVYYHRLRLAHALGTAGSDPRDWGGRDLVALVLDGFRDGQFGNTAYVNDDAWAILALRAAGVAPEDGKVQAAARAIESNRHADGGWAFSRMGTASDPDMTGMALAALAAAGRDVKGDERALLALSRARDPLTGGYRAMPNEAPNCQSTVWALHALHLLGQPEDEGARRFLLSLQQPNGGFLRFHGDTLGANAFCTTEAVVHLAGGRYPLPGYAEGRVAEAARHALEASSLRVEGPFTDARWTLAGKTVRGNPATHLFPSKGDVPYVVVAEGASHRVRLEGTLPVLSARPVLRAGLSGVDVPRHVSIELDASASVDPDGRVARLVVDWGDGNASEGADLRVAHAYEAPGDRVVTAYAVDDEGTRSDVFSATVRVRNRAPVLPPLPPRILADRVDPVALPWNAFDPDGDALTLRWREGARIGDAPDVPFSTLGNHTVRLLAQDPFGATAEGTLVVEVVNLAPSLSTLQLPERAEAGAPFAFGVEATDEDGPPPVVTWRFGDRAHDGASGNLSLPEGAHLVTVTATDADGAQRHAQATLVVGGAQDAPPALPPVANLSARLADGVLRVSFTPPPPGVRAVVSWRSAAGPGEAEAPEGLLEVPLDAAEARVRVSFHLGPLVASAEAGPVRRAQPATLARPLLVAPEAARAGERVVLESPPVEDAASYRFDLGDGNATGWLAAPRVEHAWTAGTYEVRLVARAEDGRTSTATAVLTVRPAPVARTPAEVPAMHPTAEEAPGETEAEDAPSLIPAARRGPAPAPEAGRHETPAPPALAVLLGLALLLRRGRRAA